jgi:hypothetical protein
MYFLRGSLPWQGCVAQNKEQKYEMIKLKKAATSVEELTQGYPKEFKNLINYSRKLRFEERPDYQQIIQMFRSLFVRERFDFDFVYDWNVRKQALKATIDKASKRDDELRNIK